MARRRGAHRCANGKIGFPQHVRPQLRFRLCRVLGMGKPLVLASTVLVVLAGDPAPAPAQSNLDAGKSPAQIFADTCNACHRSARELKQAGAGFLRDHYMTGPREAAAMAAYLSSVGTDARAVQQRRPPAMGAGQAPPAENRPAQSVPPGAAPPPVPASPTAATPSRSAQAGAQAGAPVIESARPALATTPRPRRPAESVEIGVSAHGGDGESSAAPRPAQSEEFEE